MRILVLGGTRFAGRAIVEAALGRGDAVTMFNRGITNHGLFPGVETVIGDRTEDLLPLGRREFDAVVDVACYDPATARVSAEALRGRVGRYVFVSTVSVYASQATTEAQREDAPLAELKPDVADPLENYGANKALCEAVIREAYGERALIGRPAVAGVELTNGGLQVRASDYGTFSRELAGIARAQRIRLRELLPEDESLESVFAYLVEN